MPEITDELKRRIWDEVREEFPDDEMMQQIHYVRLLHYYQTKDMSSEEKTEFLTSARRKPAA